MKHSQRSRLDVDFVSIFLQLNPLKLRTFLRAELSVESELHRKNTHLGKAMRRANSSFSSAYLPVGDGIVTARILRPPKNLGFIEHGYFHKLSKFFNLFVDLIGS